MLRGGGSRPMPETEGVISSPKPRFSKLRRLLRAKTIESVPWTLLSLRSYDYDFPLAFNSNLNQQFRSGPRRLLIENSNDFVPVVNAKEGDVNRADDLLKCYFLLLLVVKFHSASSEGMLHPCEPTTAPDSSLMV